VTDVSSVRESDVNRKCSLSANTRKTAEAMKGIRALSNSTVSAIAKQKFGPMSSLDR
jgi:hypothetical protein